MFELARRFIKTGMVFLVLGILLGTYMAVSRHFAGDWPGASLMTAHAHLLLVGFLLSLIFGVAIWMFPRMREQKTYSPRLSEAVYWLLTIGTSVRFVFELWLSIAPELGALRFLIALGALSQALAVLLFVFNIWTRIRPVGKQV